METGTGRLRGGDAGGVVDVGGLVGFGVGVGGPAEGELVGGFFAVLGFLAPEFVHVL